MDCSSFSICGAKKISMTSLETITLHIQKKAHTFFIPQTTVGVWVRVLSCVIVLNIVGITLSLLFFFKIKNMNQPIISLPDVAKKEDIDKSIIEATLDSFSRRTMEFEYRKINGVPIPEPR